MSQAVRDVETLLARADRMSPGALRAMRLPPAAGRPDALPGFGRRADLHAHLEMLAGDFAGRTLLEFAHAAVIVRLRRRAGSEAALARFRDIWAAETDFLLARLDSRWLVSACDTWLEHGPDPEDRAYGLAGTLFVNALKLAETERRMTPDAPAPDPDLIARDRATPLFDGVTAFVPAGGDMLRNLETRLDALAGDMGADRPAARAVQELYARAKRHDTPVGRMHALREAPPAPPRPALRRAARMPRKLRGIFPGLS